MDRLDARNAALALYGMIVRPGATLCRIFDEPGRYLVPSVAVLAATIAVGMLSNSGYAGYQMISISWSYALYGSIVGPVLSGLLLIVGIFWIGRRWGGNRSFRRAFPVLAYCLVPSMLWILAGSVAHNLYLFPVPETDLSDGPYLTFSYGVDFIMIRFVIGFFFIGWMLLLHMKAIRILNGFGYARSAAILALAVLILYAEGLARGLITAALFEFVL